MKKRLVTFCILLITVFCHSSAPARETVIRILHVNDFHGFAEPYKPAGFNEMLGSAPSLAAKVNKLRAEKPSLLLSAGDMIHGQSWATFHEGESVIDLMNVMGFDAMVVGNHEFDFGQDVLKQRIAQAEFPVLAANIQGMGMLMPYIIKEIAGVRIGIIGVVTDDTPSATHPRNVNGLNFTEPQAAVGKYIAELTDRADIIIVLSHIGYHADRILAEKVKGIDIIVGGHSHTKINKPVPIGKTLIVQAWEHGKALGVLDITVKNGKIVKYQGHLEKISPRKGDGDKTVNELVEKYRNELNAAFSKVIGATDVDLDGEHVRYRETNLGNLIADVMREASGADAAIINGGGIRAGIRKGEIRMKDIHAALPFDNYIVALKLTGRQIRDTLEYGVSAVDKRGGQFPQVSGLRFTYSVSSKTGSRIKEVQISGQPLDPDREYIVATHDFLAAGGDGYTVFGDVLQNAKNEKLVYNDSGRWLRDIVINHIINMHSRISVSVEDRIREVP